MGMKPEYNEPAKVVSLPKKAAGFHDIHLMILDFVKPWGGEVVSTMLTGKDGRNRGMEVTVKFTGI